MNRRAFLRSLSVGTIVGPSVASTLLTASLSGSAMGMIDRAVAKARAAGARPYNHKMWTETVDGRDYYIIVLDQRPWWRR